MLLQQHTIPIAPLTYADRFRERYLVNITICKHISHGL